MRSGGATPAPALAHFLALVLLLLLLLHALHLADQQLVLFQRHGALILRALQLPGEVVYLGLHAGDLRLRC